MCRETGPSPSHCSLGAGWDTAGGWGDGGFGQHLTGKRLVAVCDGARDAVKFQETGRIGGHSCMGDLGRPRWIKAFVNEAFSRAGMVRAFAWANNRRKVVVSWLQRPPTSMASTTSLQRRVVFRPWWNREQFQRHTESMHHVSHRLRPILAIRTRPTIDRNILGCDTLMLSNCTFVKSSQVKSSQTCTPISAGPFRAQAQNVSNCSPNMLHQGE